MEQLWLRICTQPPDVGQFIRSFDDEDIYNYVVNGDGDDASERLSEMLERLGSQAEPVEIIRDVLFSFGTAKNLRKD